MANKPAPPNGPAKNGNESGKGRGNNPPTPGKTPPPAPSLLRLHRRKEVKSIYQKSSKSLEGFWFYKEENNIVYISKKDNQL